MSNGMSIPNLLLQDMIYAAILVVLMCLSFVCIEKAAAGEPQYGWGNSADAAASANIYGADANPTGNPIGGGTGYTSIFLKGDYEVSTAEELVEALARVTSGQIIYVRPEVEIDLTRYAKLQVPEGVILAGNRGHENSAGPLLFTNSTTANPLIAAAGPGVRITGLRFRGADGGIDPIDYIYDNTSIAIKSEFTNLEVDNCEIFNFSVTGVSVNGKDAYVHHNYIHHVRREGLGYPVQVSGTALIEANIFDYYRHAIAASGFPGVGYEARYNIALAHATNTVFDMHGGADFCYKKYSIKPTCTNEEWWMAGEWFSIHHNTIMEVGKIGIGIRGVPWKFGEVHHNWFMTTNTDRAFKHIYFEGNVAVYDNVYGPNKMHLAPDKQPSALVKDLGGLSRKGVIVSTNNSIVDINEKMSDSQLRIGFSSPLSENTLAVKGVLPVDVEINDGGLLKIGQVQVLLGEQIIYCDKNAPPNGTLTIDTRELSDRLYELKLIITDERGGEIKRSARFKPENWSIMVDEFLPPMKTSSIFAGLDIKRTIDESGGWRFIGDQTDLLFNDANRKTRINATDEYLIYHTPSIKRFYVVVYTNIPIPANSLIFYTSNDGVIWVPISYSTSERGDKQGNWSSLTLSTEIGDSVEVNYLKVYVSADIPAASLQIGKVEIWSENQR